MNIILYISFVLNFFLFSFHTMQGQTHHDINRIEFNSGTRTFREQIILTPDSVLIIKEDFRVDLKPNVIARSASSREWSEVIESISNVRLTEIATLQSPSMKRTFDAAAHGSLIITTADGKSFTHGFDDENPHKKLRPLMDMIRKIRKK